MHYQEGVEGVKGMKSVSYQDVLQEENFEQEVENTNTLNFFNIECSTSLLAPHIKKLET